MTFLLGTRNAHKLKEMTELLPDLKLEALPAGIEEPVEDGDSFKANARIKSEAYAKATQSWVIADDSGICVTALDHAPGIHSARFAGLQCDDEANNDKLLEKLKDEENRAAYYVCVLSLASPEGEVFSVEGHCSGSILHEREGKNGFGYDPLFYSNDLKQSFGVADPLKKARVSHRAVACFLFQKELKKRELPK
jgi:XTP/dITP diphosphohydrolase